MIGTVIYFIVVAVVICVYFYYVKRASNDLFDVLKKSIGLDKPIMTFEQWVNDDKMRSLVECGGESLVDRSFKEMFSNWKPLNTFDSMAAGYYCHGKFGEFNLIKFNEWLNAHHFGHPESPLHNIWYKYNHNDNFMNKFSTYQKFKVGWNEYKPLTSR